MPAKHSRRQSSLRFGNTINYYTMKLTTTVNMNNEILKSLFIQSLSITNVWVYPCFVHFVKIALTVSMQLPN